MIKVDLKNLDSLLKAIDNERWAIIRKHQTRLAIAAEQLRRAMRRNCPNDKVTAETSLAEVMSEVAEQAARAGTTWLGLYNALNPDREKIDYSKFLHDARETTKRMVFHTVSAVAHR